MAHNVLANQPVPTAWTPYGRENQTSIYVKDSVYGEKDFTAHMVAKDFSIVQNKIAIGSVTLYGITTDLQGYFTRGNRVKIFIGNTILYVFEIENVSFDTTGACLLRLEGIECKDNKRAFTDRTTYNLDNTASNTITNKLISRNDDGASPFIFEQGIITNFGNVFFRAESERRLKALMQQADYHQADWWISWVESSGYDVDYYNIKKDRGSGVSRYTFYESGMDKNTVTLTNTEKQNNIANYIICIGAGNELTSINYHATTNRTNLNGGDTWLNGSITATDLTITVDSTAGFAATGTFSIGTETFTYTSKTDTTFVVGSRTGGISHADRSEVINTTTLVVDSTTGFPNTGNDYVWVGSEKIKYTGLTATTLTGITRGQSSTIIYAHMDNIEVWDAQYTTTTSQSGSSIYTNGLIEEKYDFRSVIDRNTIDLAAQNLLFERKNISKNIVVVPAKMYTILDNEKLVCGDLVTVDAELADLDGDYEIKGIRVYSNIGSQEMCELDLGEARVLDAVTQISDAKMIARELSSYAQGSPVIVSDSESDNCDTSVNLTDEFYGVDLDVIIPRNTIAVKNMNLNYTIGRYKVFASSTPSGGGSTTVTGGGSTTVSGGGSTSGNNYVISGISPTSHTSGSDMVTGVSVTGDGSTYDDLLTGISLPQNNTGEIVINLTMYASANMSIAYIRLKDPSSNRYYPDVTGLRTWLRVASHTHTQGTDSNGDTEDTTDASNITKHASPTFVIPISWLDESASTYKLQIMSAQAGTVYYSYDIIENAAHTHTTPDHQHATPDHQHATPNHTHSITYGITSVASSCSDMQVYIDGTEKTSAIESLYGTLSTSLMNEINLADSSIFTFEAGKRYSIKVRPTGKCFIHAGIQGELFIKSTT